MRERIVDRGAGAVDPSDASFDPQFVMNSIGAVTTAPELLGPVTSTRTTVGGVWGADGAYINLPAGVQPVKGGRYIENRIMLPRTFEDEDSIIGWEYTDPGAFTYTPAAIADRHGNANASATIEVTTGADPTACIDTRVLDSTEGIWLDTIVIGIWLIGLDGTTVWNINFWDGFVHHQVNLTLTDEWQWYAISNEKTSGDVGCYFFPVDTRAGNMNNGTFKAGIDFCTAEVTTGRPNQAPSEFIDSSTDYGCGRDGVKWSAYENGNTISGNKVIEGDGRPILPPPAMQFLPDAIAVTDEPRTMASWTRNAVNKTTGQAGFAGFPESVLMASPGGVGSPYFARPFDAVIGDVFEGIAVVKSSTRPVLHVTAYSQAFPAGYYVNFILDGEGSIGLTNYPAGTFGSAKIKKLADGGYECTFSITATATGEGNIAYIPSPWNQGQQFISYDGSSGNGLLFAYVATVRNRVASPPIPRSAALYHRTADSMTLGNADQWVNAGENVWLMGLEFGTTLSDDIFGEFIRLGTDSSPVYHSSGQEGLGTADPGQGAASIGGGIITDAPVLVAVVHSTSNDFAVMGIYAAGLDRWTWQVLTGVADYDVQAVAELAASFGAEYRQSGLIIYDGIPPGVTTSAEAQAWIAGNAKIAFLTQS